MEVLLDGQSIDAEFSGTTTIESTVRQVQTDHCEPDRMVVGIRCDDNDVPGDAMVKTLGQPVASVRKLEVITSTRCDLVIAAMAQAAAALRETDAACKQVGTLLSEGKTTEGIRSLGECLAVWQQIHEAVTKSVAMLELDLESMSIREEPFLAVLGRPRDVLVQIKEALTAQDYVLLSDLLQYEFEELTDQWYAVIAAIRQEAEDRNVPGGS